LELQGLSIRKDFKRERFAGVALAARTFYVKAGYFHGERAWKGNEKTKGGMRINILAK
jgi:hypothetical protein